MSDSAALSASLFGSVDVAGLTARLATILDVVGDGVIAIDDRQVIRMVNREIERIFGYQRQELVGEQVQLIVPKRYHARHAKAFSARLASSAPMPRRYVEVEGVRKDGSVFPLELRFSQATLDGQKMFVGALRDITDRVEARREIERLQKALRDERDYLREEVKSRGQYGNIVGESAALKMVLAQVDAVARSDATSLILGESGTGKELIARALHERSNRAKFPLVRVNCASVPRELFESEFFGHKKGAFTGAVRDRVGRFMLAHKGTIFLDEVGEIPLELQSKLLRVLQEHEFEPVGDERTSKVDVRVVAATNRDLQREVEAGRFREDLYYRLGVFPIHVPALRERSADIVPLAQHFLRLAAERGGSAPPSLSVAIAKKLEAYAWPGNIRELQNVMERALILASGKPITESMLALPSGALRTERFAAPRFQSAPSASDPEAIVAALQRAGGKVARAARELGLSRQALYRRMLKHGIETPRK